MKYCYTTLALFLGLFSATMAFGQNGTPKILRASVALNPYPVPGTSDSTRYYYDDNGRYSAIYRYTNYTAANVWRLVNRTTDYVYSPSGKLLSTLDQRYDENVGWVDASRIAYKYDSNDNQISYLEQYHNDTAGWVNDVRILSDYDDAGNEISTVIERWYDSIWVLNNALYFTYDAAGNVLTRTTDDNYRIIYTWDGAGNKLSETSVHLDSGIWEAYSRRIYLYGFNPDLPPVEIWYQRWGNSTWETDSRLSYTYNASGDLTDIVYQYKTGPGWTNSSWYHYEFNQNHQEVFYEYHDWGNNAWTKHTRYYTTYDADSDIILKKRWQWGGSWYVVGEERFYYDETSPVYTPQHDDFTLFPNPTTDVVTLKGTNMLSAEIFNVKGELVTSSPLFGADEKTLQLGNVPAGNYFLRLLTKDGGVSTKSFQVRN